MQRTFNVPAVHCGHCKSSIEGALHDLDGVDEAVVDLAARTVAVAYDDGKVGEDELVAAIEDVGYDVAPRPTLPQVN